MINDTPSVKPYVILGKTGELKAVNYLVEKGFIILEKNHRNPLGEIDIIAKKEERIHFIEVKTRTSKKFGAPRESVGYSKRNKIRMAAMYYLKNKKQWGALMSFDVLEVQGEEIVFLEACF